MSEITPEQVQATIDYVKSLAAGRTRYEGSELYRDEILVGEIERLREEIGWAERILDDHGVPKAEGAQYPVAARIESALTGID